ncbi:hypothetical protein ARMSODRAFT_978388 [Armillaria solidipes]|uniref:Uncharacterized protein n=1 Tax=Armillaria solidipes TaxID=1076256 RepID=A0A2H3BN27_9AGAR|nr:hypothetical protein ARMSODRAFT_978388 [Armillaria solidipes]
MDMNTARYSTGWNVIAGDEYDYSISKKFWFSGREKCGVIDGVEQWSTLRIYVCIADAGYKFWRFTVVAGNAETGVQSPNGTNQNQPRPPSLSDVRLRSAVNNTGASRDSLSDHRGGDTLRECRVLDQALQEGRIRVTSCSHPGLATTCNRRALRGVVTQGTLEKTDTYMASDGRGGLVAVLFTVSMTDQERVCATDCEQKRAPSSALLGFAVTMDVPLSEYLPLFGTAAGHEDGGGLPRAGGEDGATYPRT